MWASERASGWSAELAGERAGERAGDRAGGRANERVGVGRASERASERAGERAGERADERAGGALSERGLSGRAGRRLLRLRPQWRCAGCSRWPGAARRLQRQRLRSPDDSPTTSGPSSRQATAPGTGKREEQQATSGLSL